MVNELSSGLVIYYSLQFNSKHNTLDYIEIQRLKLTLVFLKDLSFVFCWNYKKYPIF